LARRDLPPLRALTAFEAAARLGSFRMASTELGITRSAVSHQIKLLEDRLGIRLFRRDARRAELTKEGHTYFPPVRDAFDQIETQTRALRPLVNDTELTIQVYVTVAIKWLIPRLHDFERRFPNMKVRLSTSYVDWDFDEKNVDVALILVRNKHAGHYYRPLFNSVLQPVCSPKLLVGVTPLRKLEDLQDHKLIDVYTAEEDWQLWLDAAGVKGVSAQNRLAVDSYILAQEAAVEGRGIAMTIGPFASEDIRLGRLAEPFALRVAHRHKWYFACKTENRNKPKIRRFEDWLAKQVESDPALANYREPSETASETASETE
jgi:LysR family transcriptional regulator, glycine cleavage system transcriptional activator